MISTLFNIRPHTVDELDDLVGLHASVADAITTIRDALREVSSPGVFDAKTARDCVDSYVARARNLSQFDATVTYDDLAANLKAYLTPCVSTPLNNAFAVLLQNTNQTGVNVDPLRDLAAKTSSLAASIGL